VQEFNARDVAPRLKEVGEAMGLNLSGLTAEAGAKAAIQAIRQLSVDVGIPPNLTALGAKAEDIPTLAANAMKDACGLTNPRRASQAEIEGIFAAAM